MISTRRSEAGATFLEAVLVVPLLFLAFITTITFGLGLSQHAFFTDGVRAASRAAVATLGSCDAKKDKAEQVLSDLLEGQRLHFENIGVENSSTEDAEEGAGFGKRGIKVKVRGKLMGFFAVEYRAFSGFEGGDDCEV